MTRAVEELADSSYKETLFVRVVTWCVLAFSFAYVLAFLRRTDIADDVVWILHLKGYLLVALMHAVLYFVYRRLTDHINLGPGLKKVKSKVPADRAVPVRIKILQDNAITGVDEGYLWVENGTVFYKGLQTVFRLNWDDVPPTTLWKKEDRPNPELNKLPDTLPVPTQGRDLRVKFEILDADDDFGARRKAITFQSELLDWLDQRPKGSLESLLPPVDVHPALVRKGFPAKEAVIATAALVLLDIALAVSLNYGVNFKGNAYGFAILATILHLVLLILSFRLFIHCLRAFRVRHSLARPLWS